MRSRITEGIIIGLCLGAVGSSAKAILDVVSLKEKSEFQLRYITEMRQDIKEIRNYLLGGRND